MTKKKCHLKNDQAEHVLLNHFMTEADNIETSPLNCGANQWTGFYMISASVMNGLIIF